MDFRSDSWLHGPSATITNLITSEVILCEL